MLIDILLAIVFFLEDIYNNYVQESVVVLTCTRAA